jgi:phage gpG-like protein
MPGLSVHYDSVGEDLVEHRLLGMGMRAEQLSPVLHAIADDLRTLEARLFQGQGFGAWPALKQSTKERKASEGLDPRILHATLALRDSLSKEHAGGFEIVTGDSLHFGTSVPYATFHKTGTRNMPKRDPLIVKETDRRRWTKMIQRFIVEADRAQFGTGSYGIGLTSPFGA